MSECVVRMEMPEGCWGCPFGHYDWIWGDDGREKMVCFCCLDGESEEDGHYLLETEQKRPSWCPIVCQLPEGHGRLVDADQLIHETHLELVEISMNGLKGTPAYADDLRMMCKRLADEDIAPTIVPEERSET